MSATSANSRNKTTINPDHLLDGAERLLVGRGTRRQADLRRAVSAAYYGLFHFVLGQAADEFIGVTRRGTPSHALVCRGLDHARLRAVCDEVAKDIPSRRYQPHMPPGGFGEAIREFADWVQETQTLRHAADYDPRARFLLTGPISLISTTRGIIATFRDADAEERRAFLALLFFAPR